MMADMTWGPLWWGQYQRHRSSRTKKLYNRSMHPSDNSQSNGWFLDFIESTISRWQLDP